MPQSPLTSGTAVPISEADGAFTAASALTAMDETAMEANGT